MEPASSPKVPVASPSAWVAGPKKAQRLERRFCRQTDPHRASLAAPALPPPTRESLERERGRELDDEDEDDDNEVAPFSDAHTPFLNPPRQAPYAPCRSLSRSPRSLFECTEKCSEIEQLHLSLTPALCDAATAAAAVVVGSRQQQRQRRCVVTSSDRAESSSSFLSSFSYLQPCV